MSPRKRTLDPHGILLLHASSVRTESGALIFLGPSGAGKSTLTRLLCEETRVLADDKIYLVPQADGTWGVADATKRCIPGPLSDEEARSLETAPLQAIHRIYQAATDFLKPLHPADLYRHLLSAFLELWWHRTLDTEEMKKACRGIGDISRRTPGHDLHFRMSPRVADMLWVRHGRQKEICFS